jgi:hypothetical protein
MLHRKQQSRGDLARATGDHSGQHDVVLRWRPIAVEAAEEHLSGSPSHARWILGDDGDSRFQEIGKQDVVEADQGNAPVKF